MTTADDEHTALRWACAMSRVRMVEPRPNSQASSFHRSRTSSESTQADQTAPSATTTDLRKFPQTLRIAPLARWSTSNRQDRTAFHHVIDLALSRGKARASRYYLETVCNGQWTLRIPLTTRQYPSQPEDA
ncbi:hypothetical protein CF319_g5593 [Tilletia indica]|nr:hypothetical protein CF319_g5593 [Tilletia indica]